MPIRLRKLIGAVLLIVLVAVWALLAMAFAQSPLVKANGVIEVIYYVVAGLGWGLPAMPLIRWMSRPGRARPCTGGCARRDRAFFSCPSPAVFLEYALTRLRSTPAIAPPSLAFCAAAQRSVRSCHS